VNRGELKNGSHGSLQYVKDGEELVIRDRSLPIARILHFGRDEMPEDAMDWNEFFLVPAGHVAQRTAVEAALREPGRPVNPAFWDSSASCLTA
jgi:antitoxin (DNA-binding transcriptional repressor) of toxin-antitoxin stability system